MYMTMMATMADVSVRAFGPHATINLQALRHNLSIARQLTRAKLIAVIKADAYGHGMLQAANALADADMLAVARVSEGVKLRQAGITQPILVLEGFFEAAEIHQAIDNKLELVVHQLRQIELLEIQKTLPADSLVLWLKVDTGMHRLGIDASFTQAYFTRLQKLSCCHDLPRLMTHFANADDRQNDFTHKQIKLFRELTASTGAQTSLANSAGIIAWPEAHSDWDRPGVMLYGASPMIKTTAAEHALQPVMTLSSHLLAVNQLKQGDCIGYGSSWCCPEDMPVGVVAIGYGDGYPRHAKSGTPVLVNGQLTQLVGRVSMDMITVDLRGINAVEGDPVVLWGEGLPAEQVAAAAETISYELFCGVTSRVKYQYQA